jgi:ribose transport system substrate-binding protein
VSILMKKITIITAIAMLSVFLVVGFNGCKPSVAPATEAATTEAATTEAAEQWQLPDGTKYTPKPNDYGFKPVPPDQVLVGDIIIVTQHEFQIRQRAAFEQYCKEQGAKVLQDAGEFDPERQRKILESMVAQGVQAVNYYGLDPSSAQAQSTYLADNGIFTVLQWEDFETVEYPYPVASVITSDNNSAPGGEYAAKLFEEQYGKDAKAIGGIIDEPQSRNCIMRAESFKKGFEEVHPNVEWFQADGKGMRDPAREAGEALIRAHPDMTVGYGINDDSTFGFMAALEAAGKTADNFILIGFDGTIAAYDAMKRGTMFRADIAQDPEAAGYNGAVVAIAIARGEKTFGDFPRNLLVNVCNLVTLDNIDPFYEKAKAAVELIKGLQEE